MLKVQKQVFIDLDIKKEIGYKRYIRSMLAKYHIKGNLRRIVKETGYEQNQTQK